MLKSTASNPNSATELNPIGDGTFPCENVVVKRDRETTKFHCLCPFFASGGLMKIKKLIRQFLGAAFYTDAVPTGLENEKAHY